MDMLRSCYATTMVFRTGDSPVPVLWYWCYEGALCHPSFNFGHSHNWQSRVSEEGAIGEQPGPRFWSAGSKPANGGKGDQVALDCVNALASAWENGLAPGQETGPYDEDGVPICCKAPCCECVLPDVMTATVLTNPCAGISDQVFSLHRVEGECRWVGPNIDCGGSNWHLEVFVEGEEPPCSLQFQIFCDSTMVGQDGADLVCDSGVAQVTINPIFNPCCNETHDIDLAWEVQ